MQEVKSIGPITISVEQEGDQVVLILENCGNQQEKIYFHYQKSYMSGTVMYGSIELLRGATHRVKLPNGFEKWHRFYCRLDEKNQNSNPPLDLKELVSDAQIETINQFPSVEIKPPISNIRQADDSSPIISKESESEKEMDNVQVQILTDDQQEVKTTVQDSQKHLTEAVDGSQDDIPNDFVNVEKPTLSQNAPPILWIAHAIGEWLTELNQSYERNSDLIETLRYADQTIKDKLKTFSDYEQDSEVNSAGHNQFIAQFVKDRLFNGVARFLSFEQVPEQLDQILQLAGYAVIPIEIGKTKADARVHDIQGSQQTGVNPGTIVEVILPGLQRKVDGEIVQKPVVIRGE